MDWGLLTWIAPPPPIYSPTGTSQAVNSFLPQRQPQRDHQTPPCRNIFFTTFSAGDTLRTRIATEQMKERKKCRFIINESKSIPKRRGLTEWERRFAGGGEKKTSRLKDLWAILHIAHISFHCYFRKYLKESMCMYIYISYWWIAWYRSEWLSSTYLRAWLMQSGQVLIHTVLACVYSHSALCSNWFPDK